MKKKAPPCVPGTSTSKVSNTVRKNADGSVTVKKVTEKTFCPKDAKPSPKSTPSPKPSKTKKPELHVQADDDMGEMQFDDHFGADTLLVDNFMDSSASISIDDAFDFTFIG